MAIVKANKESEAGVMLGEEILAKMGKYNEQLIKSGVMLGADGLWLWQVRSIDEAVEMAETRPRPTKSRG